MDIVLFGKPIGQPTTNQQSYVAERILAGVGAAAFSAYLVMVLQAQITEGFDTPIADSP